MTLTFGSLFDGIGGFIIALERAGMKCKWRSEIDKYCNELIDEKYPDIPNLGDVRNVIKETAEPVSLICGGFPCTDLSVAGKRAGLAGEQSGLWYEFHRIIEELRPRWVVIENVVGLLSSSGGRDMGIIIGTLAKLRYGYAWTVLDAQYRGLAQRRKRVFIVANSRDWTYPAKVLFESSCVPGSFEAGRGAGQRTAAPIKASTPSRRNGGSSPVEDEFIVTGALTKRFAGESNQWAPWNEAEHLVAQTINSRNNRLNVDQTFVPKIAASLTASRSHGLSGGKDSYPHNHIAQTVVMQGSGGHEGRGWRDDGISFTLNSSDIPSVGVRRLTPLECERLQGFPDRFTEDQSDTQRYKQLGNAVAVPVVQWIGERIMAVHFGKIANRADPCP